jgi:hypothetical protein
MSIINFDQVLETLDGKELKMSGTDMSVDLRTVCIQSLIGSTDTDQTIKPEKKLSYYTLAQAINKGGKVEVKAEDIADLKRLIGSNPMMNIIVVGQVYEMLEGK